MLLELGTILQACAMSCTFRSTVLLLLVDPMFEYQANGNFHILLLLTA